LEDVEKDRQRAEIFDALGHPTRITILKALSEGALGFADLKKKTGIESSGHLQHHLSKLNGLIKTDENGKYVLSDQGKDALFTVLTAEKAAGPFAKEAGRAISAHGLRSRRILTSVIVLLAIASLLGGLYVSNIAVSPGQYFYDLVSGSPLSVNPNDVILPISFQIQPNHSLNYTVEIFLNNTNHPHVYGYNNYFTFDALPPIYNSTFYRQDFLGFQVELQTVTEWQDINAYFSPVTRPNGTLTEQVVDPYSFPPYEIEPSTNRGIGLDGGGLQQSYNPIIPISGNGNGNYTFSITNTVTPLYNYINYTATGSTVIYVSTVTMETKPLKGTENFQPVENVSSERIARIYWRPSSLYSIATGIAIVSPLFIGALCVYLVNRKS
jgi:DNA-binding transcriptional ArsR family regulator